MAADDYDSAAGYKTIDGNVPAPMVCVGKPCSLGYPNKRGITHDCVGMTTGETCNVTASGSYQYNVSDAVLGQAQTWTCGVNGRVTGEYPKIVPNTCSDNFADFSGAGVKQSCG